MASLQELITQQKALDAQIAALHATEHAGAIQRAKELIAEFELLPIDVFGIPRSTVASNAKATTKTKVAAKYYDASTGNSWSGRGIAPKWIAGKDRAQFLIAT